MARSARFQAKKLCPECSEIIIETKKAPRRDMYARYIAEIKAGKKNVADELLKLRVVKMFRYFLDLADIFISNQYVSSQ